MSIHIIIDGYNLIRNASSLKGFDLEDLQLGRDALVEMLVAYKRMKPHKITVVFDGTNAPAHFQHRQRKSGIDLIFSRPGETADTVIKRMVAREREKSLVVSSDREIIHSADSNQAATISSGNFEQKLLMAGYMDLKGVEGDDDVSGWKPTTKKKGPRRRLSKKMRRNRLRIKKL